MLINVYREGNNETDVQDTQTPGGVLTDPLIVGVIPTDEKELVSVDYVDTRAAERDASKIKIGTVPSNRLANFNGPGTDAWFWFGDNRLYLGNKSITEGWYTKVTVRPTGVADSVGVIGMSDVPNFTWDNVDGLPASQSVVGLGITDAAHKEGSMLTGNLTLHSSPVEETHAASKGYVDTKAAGTVNTSSSFPVGTVLRKVTSDTRDGFLIANGATLSQANYNELFMTIGGEAFEAELAPGGVPAHLQYAYNRSNNNVNYGEFEKTVAAVINTDAGEYIGPADKFTGGLTFTVGNFVYHMGGSVIVPSDYYDTGNESMAKIRGVKFRIDGSSNLVDPVNIELPGCLGMNPSLIESEFDYLRSVVVKPIVAGNRLYFFNAVTADQTKLEFLNSVTMSPELYVLRNPDPEGPQYAYIVRKDKITPSTPAALTVFSCPLSYNIDLETGELSDPYIETPDEDGHSNSGRYMQQSPVIHNNRLYLFDFPNPNNATGSMFNIAVREAIIGPDGHIKDYRTAGFIDLRSEAANHEEDYSNDTIKCIRAVSTKNHMYLFVQFSDSVLKVYKLNTDFSITPVTMNKPGVFYSDTGIDEYDYLHISDIITTRKRIYLVDNSGHGDGISISSLGLNKDGEITGDWDTHYKDCYIPGTDGFPDLSLVSAGGTCSFLTKDYMYLLSATEEVKIIDQNPLYQEVIYYANRIPFSGIPGNRYIDNVTTPMVNRLAGLFKLPDLDTEESAHYRSYISHGLFTPGQGAVFNSKYANWYIEDLTDTDWMFRFKPIPTLPVEEDGVPIEYQTVASTRSTKPWLDQSGLNTTSGTSLETAVLEELSYELFPSDAQGVSTRAKLFATKNKIYTTAGSALDTYTGGLRGNGTGYFDYREVDSDGIVTDAPGQHRTLVPFQTGQYSGLEAAEPIVFNGRLYLFNLDTRNTLGVEALDGPGKGLTIADMTNFGITVPGVFEEGETFKSQQMALVLSAGIDANGLLEDWRIEKAVPELPKQHGSVQNGGGSVSLLSVKGKLCMFTVINRILVTYEISTDVNGVITGYTRKDSTFHTELETYQSSKHNRGFGDRIFGFTTNSGVYIILTNGSYMPRDWGYSPVSAEVHKALYTEDGISGFYPVTVSGLDGGTKTDMTCLIAINDIYVTDTSLYILGTFYSRDVSTPDRLGIKKFDIDSGGNLMGSDLMVSSLTFTNTNSEVVEVYKDEGTLPLLRSVIAGDKVYFRYANLASTRNGAEELYMITDWSGGTADYSSIYGA